MEKLEIKLSSVLELLASNATEQIRYLEQIGGKGCVDELGLEFDDIFFVADEMFKQNKISKEYYDILCRLDSKLDCMSGIENKSLWTEEALVASEHWEEIRYLAKKAIYISGGRP